MLRIFDQGLPGQALPFADTDWHHLGLPRESRQCLGRNMHAGLPCLERADDSDREAFLFGVSSSSLDVAWELMRRQALRPWALVAATAQEKGRGQYRRSWSSPPGNAYLAVRLPEEGVFSAPGAAVLLGALVTEGLERMGIPSLMKWPNDVVAKDGGGSWVKAGGILLEEKRGTLLAGIGLNIRSSPPPCLLHGCLPAASLFSLGVGGAFSPLLAGILDLVRHVRFCYISHFLHRSFEECFCFAESKLAFRDAFIQLAEEGGKSAPVRLVGLVKAGKDAGRLIVREEGGQTRVSLADSFIPCA